MDETTPQFMQAGVATPPTEQPVVEQPTASFTEAGLAPEPTVTAPTAPTVVEPEPQIDMEEVRAIQERSTITNLANALELDAESAYAAYQAAGLPLEEFSVRVMDQYGGNTGYKELAPFGVTPEDYNTNWETYTQFKTANGETPDKAEFYQMYLQQVKTTPEFIDGLDSAKLAKPTRFNTRKDSETGEDISYELPEDKVRSIAKDLGIDPTTPEGMNAVYARHQIDNVYDDVVRGYIGDFTKATAKDWSWFKSIFGTNAAREYDRWERERDRAIIDSGAMHGWQLAKKGGMWTATLEDGTVINVDDSFTANMMRSKFGILGGLVGTISGISSGAAAIHAMKAPTLPAKVGILTFSTIFGGAMGGAVGGQLDYLEAAMRSDAEYSVHNAFDRFLEDFAFGAAMEAVGIPTGAALAYLGKGIYKVGSKGAMFTKQTLVNLYKSLRGGDIKGAVDDFILLKPGTSYDEALVKVKEIEKLMGVDLGKSDPEKVMKFLSSSNDIGAYAASIAASKSDSVRSTILTELHQRAEVIRKQLAEYTSKYTLQDLEDPVLRKELLTNVPKLAGDLKSTEMKIYGAVEASGEALAGRDYTFSFAPFLQKLRDSIADSVGVSRAGRRTAGMLGEMEAETTKLTKFITVPNTSAATANTPSQYNFQQLMAALKETQDQSLIDVAKIVYRDDSPRTFRDLMQIRKFINSRYTKSTQPAKEYAIWRDIKNAVDEELFSAVQNNPTWKAQFEAANKAFSEVSNYFQGPVYKATKDASLGKTSDIWTRWLKENPGHFEEAISMLGKIDDKGSRHLVPTAELAALQDFIADPKYTIMEGNRAVAMDFAKLSEDLSLAKFTSPEARILREAIDTMGAVFQADRLNYELVSGRVLSGSSSSGMMAVTPWGKAKVQVATYAYEKIKEIVPNSHQKALAIRNTLINLLNDPYKITNEKAFFDALESQEESIIQAIEAVRVAGAATSGKKDIVNVYRATNGLHYTKAKQATGSVDRYSPIQLDKANIATMQEAVNVLQTSKFNLSALTYGEKQRLIEKGILAIRADDDPTRIILLQR